MLTITVTGDGLVRFQRAMKMLEPSKFLPAADRAVNRTGDMARTQVRRTLTTQTGLKRATIVKAVHVARSTPTTLTYQMRSKGGDISLKHFAARETRKGVSAAPFGKRKVFAGTFIKGGRFPNRVVAKGLNGHVYLRLTKKRGPIQLQDSGVVIPEQMVTGATGDAFRATVARVLPPRMAHEIRRLTGGVVS